MDKEYSITFSGRFHYMLGGGLPLHSHDDDYQVQLVYGGGARAQVNQEYYTLKPGDILFIKKGSYHEYKVTSKEGLKTLEVKFFNPSRDVLALIDKITVLLKDKDNRIFKILSRIIEEGFRKLPGYKTMSTALLTESLIEMERFCEEATTKKYNSLIFPLEPNEKRKSRILKSVDEYVFKNIDKKFSMKDLSNGVGYNQDYLYRAIHKETGLSTIQYVNSLRFEQAKKLIQHTELSLSEIAWNLGFDTLQYFSKFFKEHAEISPSEYLEKTRHKVRTDY